MQQTNSYQVGDATVTRVMENWIGGVNPRSVLPAWSDEIVARHADRIPSECWDTPGKTLAFSIHSWLVKTPRHTVLIDTGLGNHKQRKAPDYSDLNEPFLERLATAGARPEEIDYVLLTHLHVDHVGWNTRLENGRWVPTFPKAKYVFSKVEEAQFSGPGGRERPIYEFYEDSILPVIEAGQAMMMDGSVEFLDDFFLHPTPGHTPDHWSIGFSSRGAHALFGGDVMHSPIQAVCPELSTRFCVDRERATSSRLWALQHCVEKDAIFFSTHFTGTSAGRIERSGDQFSWRFA